MIDSPNSFLIGLIIGVLIGTEWALFVAWLRLKKLEKELKEMKQDAG
jgi:gas vesicle protein